VLKNALYFGGASPDLMNYLFPPPAYELPSDAFFEISGVMQVVPSSLAAWSLYRVRQYRARAIGRAVHTSPVRDDAASPSLDDFARPRPSA
jgi:hypothetical protein